MATSSAYALNGAIAPTRLSHGYRLGLLIVAVTMLVLPLIYAGIIGLVGRLVWWHLTANTWILMGRDGAGVWRLVGFLGPAVAGVVVMFFMVKPVFARPARHVDPVPIRPEGEPVLFRFIADICEQVRAPAPARVQVDCQVNASASFAAFPLPLRRPSLVLTIGLPLGGGLTVRQLGGVIAHEFGHFAQGGGMKLTFIVRSINNWFSRVVYERDDWDEKLDRWSSSGSWMVVLTLLLARASIWCSRQILRALMIAGHTISCFMLRQMEYDADSYEMKLVGSGTFLETSARLRELNVHAHVGHQELHESWIRKALPSNFPAFLLQQQGRVPPDVVAQIREIPTGKTGLFDSHPSDADRAQAAECARSQGVLDGGHEPATVLFRNFDDLSQAATRHHYEHHLGVNLEATSLVETEQALLASRIREDSQRSADAFFGNCLTAFRPVRLAWPPSGADGPAEIIVTMRYARDAMKAAVPGIAAKYRKLESLEHSRNLACAAEELIESGFSRVIAAEFDLTEGTLSDARATAARAVEQQQDLMPELLEFEAAAHLRLSCALAIGTQLADDPATRPAAEAEVSQLATALNALATAWADLIELYRLSLLWEHLTGNAEKSPARDKAARRIERTSDDLRAVRRRVRAALDNAPAPEFMVSAGGATLGDLLGLLELEQGRCGGGEVLARAAAVRFDLIGRLTAMALTAEAKLEAKTA